MKVVASLAAVLAIVALGACGGDGAEPGASDEATLVLDFQPNAVHAA
jgi:ABC-type nitrate/sulfonate/bicarbonate transport system substrate-binding protein